MTPKALIFDVDGTLAETEETHRRAFNETFAEAGLGYRWTWSVEVYRRLLRTTGGKERMRRYRSEIGAIFPTDAQITALHQAKTTRFAELVAAGQLRLRPNVAGLIMQAKEAGIRIAIATTTTRENVDALCEACWNRHPLDIFDVIAAGDEVPVKKPAPDVYLLALDRLGLTAADCIAFEDSANGLSAARAAGLACIVTPSIYTAHETFEGAARVVPDLSRIRLRDLVLREKA